MRRITPDSPWPLHDTASSRALETHAAATLPPHALMQRAGLAVARLSLALAPHAQTIWLACGPGNNGGDGFEAALHLKAWGKNPVITWAGDEARAPADALASLRRARAAGVSFADEAPAGWDLAVDAMLGLGSSRPLEGRLSEWADAMRAAAAPVLAIDLPSGLSAETGQGAGVRATHTLALLTLKPGLFTGGGRDAAGETWFDDLDVDASPFAPTAWLAGPPESAPRPHDSHKGRFGDVAVIGGAPGMTGAAVLAGIAAVHGGAGRVFVGLLGDAPLLVPDAPELMLRAWESLDLSGMSVACGCGGGEAVRHALPHVLATAKSLVLDADALNAIAADRQLQMLLRARGSRGRPTVLTPHPLEAARLLGLATAQVQADRIAAAQSLAQMFGCVAVLKGSGTVVAAPGRLPTINPTGNGRLATGGTGDVLAGLLAALAAVTGDPAAAALAAVYMHGLAADEWPTGSALTASTLAGRVRAGVDAGSGPA